MIPLCMLLIDARAYAGGNELPPTPTNIDWVLQGTAVLISYDLNAPADQQFEVHLILRDENNPSFSIEPQLVSGDVGSEVYGGKQKHISWQYRTEVPGGLKSDKLYFVVTAKPAGGGFPWLVILGIAGVGGGAAALLLKSKTTSSAPVGATLPDPPTRP